MVASRHAKRIRTVHSSYRQLLRLMMVRIVMRLQVLAVMAVCHISAVTTDFNATHKVARCALLSDHSDHRDCTTTLAMLLALWCVHVCAHR